MSHPELEAVVPKLLADAMLGKLARWLRIVGYDTVYMQGDDAAIAYRARAEGRVLLTRDRDLAKRKGLRTVLLQAETLEAQLAETVSAVGPPASDAGPRCMHCNVVLTPIARDDAARQVPAYVLEMHETFRQCRECGKIYWHGTHWQGIADRIDEALDGTGLITG